jgi:hypothetical protein
MNESSKLYCVKSKVYLTYLLNDRCAVVIHFQLNLTSYEKCEP